MECRDRHAAMIVGGGPAGLATALGLIRAGCSVIVVERGRYDEVRIGEHLPPQGIRLLLDGGFSGLDEKAHLRSTGVNAWWGSTEASYMDYLFHPVGHGVNLSRPDFDSTLADQCREAGVRLLTGARLISSTLKRTRWHTKVQWGDCVREYFPRVIVDATGRSAAFARAQGSSIEASESQVALIACRASNPPLNDTNARVLIESAEHGWWYFAPLCGGHCVCMFMTDADLLQPGPRAALATWEERLRRTDHVRWCKQAYPAMTRLVVRAARSQRLDRIAGPGWIAVGDAAIAFDPLSSQGIAKGLAHGRQAAEAVLACFDGDEMALQRLGEQFGAEFADYEETRRGYYAIERRWPDALFWRRRQVPRCG